VVLLYVFWELTTICSFFLINQYARVPGAMVAMTPVSAYLHAATMVKAGICLLMRLSPLFAGQAAWSLLLTGVGLATALVGAVLALREHDLKAVLAQSTVSQLGLLVAVIGVGTPTAMAAAMLHTVAHALFKATLFMLVGIIDRETGSRDIRELSGLRKTMPPTAACTALAALSMAGVPPMLGFVSKEYLFQGLLDAQGPAWVGVVAGALGVAASALTFAYGARIVYGAFGGPVSQPDLYEPAASFLAPAAVPALAGLVLGPTVFLLNPVVTSARTAVVPGAPPTALELWHGLSPELLMSAVRIAAGLALFRARDPVDRMLQRLRVPDGATLFDRGQDAVLRFGAVVGGPDRNASLAAVLAGPVLGLVLLGGVGMVVLRGLPEPVPATRPSDWLLLAVLAVAVTAAVLTREVLAGWRCSVSSAW
jgi:multicomponent Na+:H+ antiporter subunit A